MNTSALSDLGRRTQEPPISWLMKMTLDRPRLVSLAAGFTDAESLPTRQARVILDRTLRSPTAGRAALQYGSTAGDPELRRLTALRLQKLDLGGAGRTPSEPYAPERTLISNGSQQLLYMVTEALCSPGDFVLVEDPTYFVYLGILQSHGLHCRGIRMEPDGLDLNHLQRVLAELKKTGDLARLKLLYLVSYHQNPTSLTTSFEKKREALRLLRSHERAAGHPIYLLEDAAYRELGFNEPSAGTESALAAEELNRRAIYVGTYSKPFATGARVGFGILPEELATVVLRIKGNHDFGTSNLLQQFLARALATGAYERHLQELHARYAFKARTMTAAMRRHFPSRVQWREPEGGLYVWAELPESVVSGVNSKFFKAALRREVLYVPGELCYANDPTRPKPHHALRLSFGGASIADIRKGIARLGEVLNQMRI